MQGKKLKLCILRALKLTLPSKKVGSGWNPFLRYYKIFNLIGVKVQKIFSDKKN